MAPGWMVPIVVMLCLVVGPFIIVQSGAFLARRFGGD